MLQSLQPQPKNYESTKSEREEKKFLSGSIKVKALEFVQNICLYLFASRR